MRPFKDKHRFAKPISLAHLLSLTIRFSSERKKPTASKLDNSFGDIVQAGFALQGNERGCLDPTDRIKRDLRVVFGTAGVELSSRPVERVAKGLPTTPCRIGYYLVGELVIFPPGGQRISSLLDLFHNTFDVLRFKLFAWLFTIWSARSASL